MFWEYTLVEYRNEYNERHHQTKRVPETILIWLHLMNRLESSVLHAHYGVQRPVGTLGNDAAVGIAREMLLPCGPFLIANVL